MVDNGVPLSTILVHHYRAYWWVGIGIDKMDVSLYPVSIEWHVN
nr:hypothetical protein [Prevotella sp.]